MIERLTVFWYLLRGRPVLYGGRSGIDITTNALAIESQGAYVSGLRIHVTGDTESIRERVVEARAKETSEAAQALLAGRKPKHESFTYLSDVDPQNVHVDGRES